MNRFIKVLFVCLPLFIFTACSLAKSGVEEINHRLQGRYHVDGSAMLPSFSEGSIVIVDEKAYEQDTVQRGDVIVFQHPNSPEQTFKRVIGLPNEQILIVGGSVSIDGIEIEESYIEEAPSYTIRLQLKENEYFVLGDNRNNSSDSHSWGALPATNIIGKAVEVCETDSPETCEAIPSITYNLEN